METRSLVAYALIAILALAIGAVIAKGVQRQRRHKAMMRGSRRYRD